MKTEVGITVRPAQEGDIDTLYDLILELAKYEGKDISQLPLTKENLRLFGTKANPYFYSELAEIEGKVAGYSLFYYGFSAHLGHPILFIDDLYVMPAYRRQKIGTALMQSLAKHAVRTNCKRMEWLIFRWNDDAKCFYNKIRATLREDLIPIRLESHAITNLINTDG